MSKGLGQPAKRMLYRLYDKGKTLSELKVSGKGDTRKTDYYVLQRLIEKELVWRSEDNNTYHLTNEGKKISNELHKEFVDLLRDYLNLSCYSGKGWNPSRENKKELQQYVDNHAEIALQRDVVLIDFYSPMCEPCKDLAPFIDSLKDDPAFIDKIQIKKIDISVDSETANKYHVMAVPTVIIEKKDKVIKRVTGFTLNTYEEINNALNEALGIKKEVHPAPEKEPKGKMTLQEMTQAGMIRIDSNCGGCGDN